MIQQDTAYLIINEDTQLMISVSNNSIDLSHDKSLHPHEFEQPILKDHFPCTPTSTSFKVSQSDASHISNETIPSSIENEPTLNLNSTHNNTQNNSHSTISIKNKSTIDSSTHEIDPKSTIISSATPPTNSNRVLNKLINEDINNASTSSLKRRRHTAPQSNTPSSPVDLSTKKFSTSHTGPPPPVARSTFPSYNKLAPAGKQISHESTNSEIIRMRNSMLVKRNYKKKRKDFFEDENVLVGNKISEGHENFVMAYNMLTGIRVAVSRCSGIMKKLCDDDFKTTKKLTFNMDGSELTPSSKYDFKFKDYCPEVFRDLRNLFGLDPADYLVSITGKYILSELGSPGKSGSFFYYSRDYRFIIKTIHHSEHKQLRRILKDYHSHVKENPNTLISQFYGLHRVKMPLMNGSKKVHFIVMNNLFPPHRDIHLKYDIKGSTWGRKTEIMGKDLSQLTLKDLNWLERKDKIKFGPEKRKLFCQQLESDVKLLKKINVMDYSLLLGVHDVKQGNNSNLEKLSVFDPKSNDKSELIKTNPRDIDRENDLPSNVFPGRSKYIFYGHDGGIRATDENNEPLQEIYYLGVIDCLTNYSLKKKLETVWRSLSHSRSTISAIPANEYGDRFLKFIKDGISTIKKKQS